MSPASRAPRRRIGRRKFDFSRQVAVMAVVNRTPDSFFDAGRTFALDAAVAAVLAAAEAGADLVDIGGLAFSPRVPDPGVDGELARVVPVVEAVAARTDVPVSVDTWRVEVAAAAIEAGAAVINDVTGLRDPAMIELIARTGVGVVVAHSLAEPHQEHPSPRYVDVVGDVRAYLGSRVERAQAGGVRDEQIVIDPGHDLNKSTVQTLELTRRLGEIADLGWPMLAAVSNKDFIGETLDRERPDRLPGTLAAAYACLERGARLLRMHDVAAAVDVARMFEAIQGWRAPVRQRHNA